ncbi:hypothetical protein B0H16DRAFT_1456142 [Mycena metata]|uniref:Uncharacterized protein n=1 Tax=Mycena metata TaxID=1033252 RepID=A0AAD7JBP8_9AGAR|nr:hypothetical protein B0H16DRAFT_1456142 [Mycena metata]
MPARVPNIQQGLGRDALEPMEEFSLVEEQPDTTQGAIATYRSLEISVQGCRRRGHHSIAQKAVQYPLTFSFGGDVEQVGGIAATITSPRTEYIAPSQLVGVMTPGASAAVTGFMSFERVACTRSCGAQNRVLCQKLRGTFPIPPLWRSGHRTELVPVLPRRIPFCRGWMSLNALYYFREFEAFFVLIVANDVESH